MQKASFLSNPQSQKRKRGKGERKCFLSQFPRGNVPNKILDGGEIKQKSQKVFVRIPLWKCGESIVYKMSKHHYLIYIYNILK